MIDRAEVLRLANETGLEARVIEKDYILGWVLAGVFRDPHLARTWAFKGGTCLKKCYFETYRFSEDLDFTVTDASQLDATFLAARFQELSHWLYETTGIELPADKQRFEIYDNKRGGKSCEVRVGYRGPIAPRGGDLPRIKLDLTADETLVLPPVTRRVAHTYSDVPEKGITAQCYAFEEVFGEKIRALGERARPRDLYDVINLFRNGELHSAATLIRDVVRQKCAFKNISIPSLEVLTAFRAELAGDWTNMLGHQLPSLPPVDSFWDALPEFFSWLAGTTATPTIISPYPLAAGDEVLRLPVGSSWLAGRSTPFIEVIRFAGANRLCVDLDYVDENRRLGTRTIEPYSLRRTQEGHILLHAVRAENQQPRSYRLDRIRAARITRKTFTPRYAVELSPIGPVMVPETARRMSIGPSEGMPSRRSRTRNAPTYVFRCAVCHRRFEHRNYDAALRAHKSPDGRDCYGRHGLFEERK